MFHRQCFSEGLKFWKQFDEGIFEGVVKGLEFKMKEQTMGFIVHYPVDDDSEVLSNLEMSELMKNSEKVRLSAEKVPTVKNRKRKVEEVERACGISNAKTKRIKLVDGAIYGIYSIDKPVKAFCLINAIHNTLQQGNIFDIDEEIVPFIEDQRLKAMRRGHLKEGEESPLGNSKGHLKVSLIRDILNHDHKDKRRISISKDLFARVQGIADSRFGYVATKLVPGNYVMLGRPKESGYSHYVAVRISETTKIYIDSSDSRKHNTFNLITEQFLRDKFKGGLQGLYSCTIPLF